MDLSTFLALALAFAGGYPKPDASLIHRLDQAVQRRFASPPAVLGMSRVAMPPSFGAHFQPAPGAATDFRPEAADERTLLRDLDASSMCVGFYVFGAAILRSAPEARDFRALKGPAVVTPDTVRPAWYPPFAPKISSPDALPDWTAVYPIAREAMATFARGGATLESSAGQWQVLARPVPASSAACVGCHRVAPNAAIGGVLYLYRVAVKR